VALPVDRSKVYTVIVNCNRCVGRAEGVPLGIGYRHRSQKKLADGRKSVKISLAVLIQYRRVTDSQPASQPRCRSII